METGLFALSRSGKRPATAEEIETARPFRKKGSGPNGRTGVLFVHGFTVTPASFQQYAASLAEDGYSVAVPLLPGHGGKPEDLVAIDWESWLDAVLEAYDELETECDEVFVVGLSLGSALALQLATRRQGIGKLFLLAPAVYPSLLLKLAVAAVIPILRGLRFRYWTHVAGDVRTKDRFELGYGRTAFDGLVQLNACMKATQRLLPEVTVDALIFQGRTDHEVPARKAEQILQRLGSRRKELVWLEHSYHEIPRDDDALEVLSRIKKEIAGSSSGR